MAVSWSFALLLILTLVALITFSQPLFQSTPAAEVRHTRQDLEISSHQNLPTSKARESMVVGSQRGCRGKRKIFSRTTTEGNPPAAAARSARSATPNARIPRRSVSAHFESDRMVPTGPNPLHNNNRSQVIFP